MPAQTEERTDQNIGNTERWISILGGTALAGFGISRRSWAGAGMALAGAALAYRGASRHCMVKAALRGSGPMRLERTITIPNKPPEEVYQFWRNFENLPAVIGPLESVKVLDGRRSHWVIKGPAGKSLSWDAEITNERSGHVIEWKSLPGSDIDLSGTVRFKRKQGRGTKVHLSLRYTTPGGAIGEALANVFHAQPEARVDAGLQNLREALEDA